MNDSLEFVKNDLRLINLLSKDLHSYLDDVCDEEHFCNEGSLSSNIYSSYFNSISYYIKDIDSIIEKILKGSNVNDL